MSEPTEPTVAMLYPGHSAEDEFPELESRIGGVRLPVFHTWEGPTDHDVAALLELGSRDQLTAAAERASQAGTPDAVMWACTSGSFVYGPDGIVEQASWIEKASGAPSSSTTLAFIGACRHLGIGAVQVAATYPQAVTDHLVEVLRTAGITVVRVQSNDVPSGEDAGRLGPDAVRAMVGTDVHPEAVAVLVPDTALHTVAVVADLESTLGVPVLTANLVTTWWGLRLAGWAGRARGLGALFEAD